MPWPPELPRVPLPHLMAPPDAVRRFRLLEVVRRRLRERRYSSRTEEAYVAWIRRYVIFNDRRHPRDLGADDIRQFLTSLAVEDRVAASTQNQARAALLFLYEQVLGQPPGRLEGVISARASRRLPVVLSPREVRLLLDRLDDPARLCVRLMYGGGLRLLECVSLRVKDVDVDRREIVVRDGKGAKDRRTPLPETAVVPLKRWLRRGDVIFRRDRKAGGAVHRNRARAAAKVSECGGQLGLAVRVSRNPPVCRCGRRFAAASPARDARPASGEARC